MGYLTHWIVLKGRDVGLNGAFHVSRCHQGRSKIYVTVDEVWLQTDSLPVMVQCFLKLAPFFVNIAKIGIGFG